MDANKKLLIAHFGELWLRGRNRNVYIKMLKKNIMSQLKGERFRLEDMYDRLALRLDADSDLNSIKSKISNIFGISAYEVAYSTKPDIKHIVSTSKALLKECGAKSVRIHAHRSYKGFKFNSMDIIRRLVVAAEKIGVDPCIKDFEKELYVSVTKDEAFVYMERIRGSGGLPVGSSGKCIVLLSGGIDSPVAAWYAMKRGLFPVYLHVHGFSSNKEAMDSKISRITQILSKYSAGCSAYYVPSHVFQLGAMKSGRYELVLMKSFMLSLAESVAKKEGADCIVTGESLGQVASQTIHNIAAEESGIKIPIMRPLIGFDKVEITEQAKRLGTFEESIKPYRDVCSINSKNPATRADVSTVKELAAGMNMRKVVRRSLRMASMAAPNQDENGGFRQK